MPEDEVTTLTVAPLIDQLQKNDSALPVYIWTDEQQYCWEVRKVELLADLYGDIVVLHARRAGELDP